MHYPRAAQNPLRTRDDLQRLAVDLWTPLEPAFRAGGALALFGDQRALYGPRGEGMEGFARVLWGLGPLRAGGGGASVDWALLRSILLAGTGPGPDGWGTVADYDQRCVETPAVAVSLVWARADLWDPLTPAEQAQVAGWLARINHVTLVENNWLWFRVLTNTALRILGQPHDPAREAADFDLIDAMWHGERGYSDGPDAHRDYYVPMAMHFYGLIYARLAEDHAPVRAAGLRARSRAYAPEFLTWFAADGASIPLGRSLQYRFAQGAFWSALAFAGEEALPWGIIKGALFRHLRLWLSRPIFTETGRMAVGYGYTQPHLAEGYGSSASSYWGQKAFLALALPETHPFWQAEELPQPVLPSINVQPGPKFIVTRPADGSDAVALASSRSVRAPLKHNAAKYHKFAYSAAFGFSVSQGDRDLVLLAPDSMLALSDDHGVHWRVREDNTAIRLEGETLIARWQPWPDVTIETVLRPTPDGCGHRRDHVITTDRTLATFEGGFCLPRDPVERLRYHSEIEDCDGLRDCQFIDTEPGTHILWPLATLPGLALTLAPGTHRLKCRVYGRVNAAPSS
jgi:hypothetical protein